MGYTLHPRNKNLDVFYMGAFSFSWMLDEGVGLVIGTGPAVEPAQFFFLRDKQGRCPRYNDGFRVDADHAKAMAMAAYGLAEKEKWIAKEWRMMSPYEREEKERGNKEFRRLYREPVREDFIASVEDFAKWAWDSGGFAIR